ncbi:unnamed protein product, partial [Symbiodinium sp. KB8]
MQAEPIKAEVIAASHWNIMERRKPILNQGITAFDAAENSYLSLFKIHSKGERTLQRGFPGQQKREAANCLIGIGMAQRRSEPTGVPAKLE